MLKLCHLKCFLYDHAGNSHNPLGNDSSSTLSSYKYGDYRGCIIQKSSHPGCKEGNIVSHIVINHTFSCELNGQFERISFLYFRAQQANISIGVHHQEGFYECFCVLQIRICRFYFYISICLLKLIERLYVSKRSKAENRLQSADSVLKDHKSQMEWLWRNWFPSFIFSWICIPHRKWLMHANNILYPALAISICCADHIIYVEE